MVCIRSNVGTSLAIILGVEMGLPTQKERDKAIMAAAAGNKLAIQMLKNWAKEEAKLRKKQEKEAAKAKKKK